MRFRHLGAGEDGDNAWPPQRGISINSDDVRMCMWRAHQNAIQGARYFDVRYVAALAAQQRGILYAAERRADTGRAYRAYCSSSRTRSSRSNADLSETRNRSASPSIA